MTWRLVHARIIDRSTLHFHFCFHIFAIISAQHMFLEWISRRGECQDDWPLVSYRAQPLYFDALLFQVTGHIPIQDPKNTVEGGEDRHKA